MATHTTIQDLPDDMLHEIFGRVFADEFEWGRKRKYCLPTFMAPKGAHRALRCVCRRWCAIADWLRLSTSKIHVDVSRLADAGAIRARHPTAFKDLEVSWSVNPSLGFHSTAFPQAVVALINGSADLRRALSGLQLTACCLPALSAVVTPAASCTALTKLHLSWKTHKDQRTVPSNVFASLSSLRMLNELSCTFTHPLIGQTMLEDSALLAPLPALPDAPHLTCLKIYAAGNFVPVGSDAALGRLRRLVFWHQMPVQELMDAEDPLLLRTAFDAGTWQPSRLTGLKELQLVFGPVYDSPPLSQPSETGSRPGAEWAPLAGQVTALSVRVDCGEYQRPTTGLVAGLGALTALRDLRVNVNLPDDLDDEMVENFRLDRTGLLDLVSIDRVHAPRLTRLDFNGACTPVNLDRFPNLVSLKLGSVVDQSPLNLRSLVARSSLKALELVMHDATVIINLAELFVGGCGWPVLKDLVLKHMRLEWDTTELAGAPTAAEFEERARQLLPALTTVHIMELLVPVAVVTRARAQFVVACRQHVVPALRGLHTGGF